MMLPVIIWRVAGCAALAAGGPAGDALPLNTKRLSDKVLVARIGNPMQTIDVVAQPTARGRWSSKLT